MVIKSILGSLFGPSAESVDRSPGSDYWYRPVVAPTHAGIDVNEDVALTYSTVYACVNKLAKTMATLPVHVFRHLPDGNCEPAPGHWLQKLWGVAPNPEMSAISAREAFMANTLLWGNGILEIQETRGGEVGALWPLLTRHLTLKRDDNDMLYFEYNLPGEQMRILRFDQVVNLAAFSTDGIVGRTPIQVARESVGLGLAARQFQSSFLKNGASAAMVLQHPGPEPMSEPAYLRLIGSFNEKHEGSGNAGKTLLVEEGVTVQTVGMSFQDAQYLELGHALKEDICGMYDVPLSMIQDDKRATYANNEQKAIDWAVGSLQPWCAKIENVFNSVLLDGGREYYVKHNLDGLKRGDMAARSEFYNKMIRVGMSPNEILKLEDMNGIGPEGDRRFVSADLVPLDKIDEVIEAKAAKPDTGSPPSEPKEPGDREDARAIDPVDVMPPVVLDVTRRIVNKEVKALGNAWKRHGKGGTPETFLEWADKFYTEQVAWVRESVLPVLQSGCALMSNRIRSDQEIEGLAKQFAACHMACSLAAVHDCVSGAPERLPEELSRWQESKAGELAEGLLAKITDRE